MRAMLRSALVVTVVCTLGCASAATTLCGCLPYDCDEHVTCGDPEAEAKPVPVCVADPAMGAAEEGCGVFVSTSLGSDDNPGTRELPVRTMATAIALAQDGALRVYACAEVFAEPVEVPSGVALWGGLDCAGGWRYLGADRKTILAPEGGAVPLRFAAGPRTSIAAYVRAQAADAVQPGASSIAAVVLSGGVVEILRSELLAGNGAPGASGEQGGDGPATTGAAGWSGGPACSAVVVPGGLFVETSCEGDTMSIGGQGGEGNVAAGGDGFNGQPEPISNPLGHGMGGDGQGSILSCTGGQVGISGGDGAHGHGGFGSGRITSAGWTGEDGQHGGHGFRGQGGGGGGGSRGGSLFCGMGQDQPKGGASGGAGGAGGCGGRGGKGGRFGGASIGLVSLSGEVRVHATTIVTGRGGDGGVGGFAQLGGLGGIAGTGGTGLNGSHAGCNGGYGGQGGNGGYGGGGLGGPSIGIAHVLGEAPAQEDVSIQIGAPGDGGLGGNETVPGSAGEDGVAGTVVPFPQ